MATFTVNPNHAVHFYAFDIGDLHGNHLYQASATILRVGPNPIDTGDNVEFAGVGFSYSAGALTGGTINSITSHVGGVVDFQFSGMSMSVAAFNAFSAADDTDGFLAAVLSGADSITGSNFTDHLMGFAGNDTMNGLDGDDVLDGGTGADTMTGAKGNDTYIIDNAADVIVETGASVADWVLSSLSVDLTKGAFNGIEHVALIDSANLFVTGDSNSNWITGNNGNNKLVGNQGDDILQAGAGNDTLDGGTGADNLNGGSGNDTYWVDDAKDKVSESATDSGDAGGVDLVNSAVDFILGNYVENLTLTGAAFSATGNALDNILIGNSSGNWLSGLGGADKMIGGAGSDHYAVDNAQDQVIEAANGGQTDGVFASISYALTANVESLFLLGNQDIDGTGNSGRNYIRGNDVLIGRGGNDTINVSQGNDTVQYWDTLDGYDIVQGFDGNASGGQDVFNLDAYFDSLNVDIWDRAERIGITDNGASVDVWLDTDGDGLLNAKIATLQTADAVTVGADIQVI